MHLSNRQEPAPLPATNFGALSAYHGPKGFHWLIRGCMGGTPRPGLLQPLEQDLASLRRMGTDVIVTLTEEWAPPTKDIESAGMQSRYVPIPDMAPPTSDQAIATCAEVAGLIAEGRTVIFHCRAGRGRTGTLLALQLIWHGFSAIEAIERTRKKNQLWIESESQLQFIQEFLR